MLDLGIGPMHFGPSEDQEIDTAWHPGIAPWDFQMVQAGYNAFALSSFSSGQIVKYVHPASGEAIAFQPQQLQYTNDLNQIQAIANPQSVNAVVQDDVLFWQGAFGPGFDIRWQAQTARLDKRLVVDQASRWPTPTSTIISGGNPVARLQFIFQVSTGIDIFVNGVLWTRQPNSIRDTQAYVEFRLQGTGEVLWSFNLPRSNAAPVEDQDPDELLGTFRLRRTGPNLFVEHRIPIAWLQAADYPIEVDTTIDEQVGASTDDAFQATSDAMTLAGTLILCDATTEHLGFRWTTVAVPAGATIDSAWMSVWLFSTTNDEPQHRLRGELAADPGTFTTASNNIDSRSRTTAAINWDSANLGANGNEWQWGSSAGNPTAGGNIKSIIQEIIDQGGWAENNALVLITEQHTGDSARDLGALTYDENTTHAAKLHIEYTAGVAGASGDLNVTLGAVSLSGAGTISVAGALSSTLGGTTLSAAGKVDIVGILTQTLVAATLSADGTVSDVPVLGDLNVTLDAATLAATAQVPVDGDASTALGAVTLSADADVLAQADASNSLGAATLLAAAQIVVVGTTEGAAGILDPLTLSATAQVTGGGTSGSLVITLSDATVSAAALVDVFGAATVTLGAATLSATALVDVFGAATITLGDMALAATAQVAVQATSAAALGDMTITASAHIEGASTGNLSIVLGDVTTVATATHDFVITGVMKKQNGTIIADALVWACRESDHVCSELATTGADGSYVVHVPDQEEYYLIGHKDEGAAHLCGAVPHKVGQ